MKARLPSCSGPNQANSITGEGHFDDGSNKPSGAATPVSIAEGKPGKRIKKGISKKAKTAKQRLMMADGDVEMG